MPSQLLNVSVMQRLVRFVCLALLATQLLSGAQLVESGLERAQFYAGTCLSADPECSMSGHQVNLGDSPSHPLNLGVHLSGLLPLQEALEPSQAKAPQVAKVNSLAILLFVSLIDYPPKA